MLGLASLCKVDDLKIKRHLSIEFNQTLQQTLHLFTCFIIALLLLYLLSTLRCRSGLCGDSVVRLLRSVEFFSFSCSTAITFIILRRVHPVASRILLKTWRQFRQAWMEHEKKPDDFSFSKSNDQNSFQWRSLQTPSSNHWYPRIM